MTIKLVGVVGAGQMGSGIAQVFAVAGYAVLLHDIDQRRCDAGIAAIERSLSKFVEKGKMKVDERNAALQRIRTTTSLKDFSKADMVIEAATEEINTKLKIFSELDRIVQKDAVLASNTSSISITAIAGATERSERVIGMHFMNPVPIIRGVEVIRGTATSDATVKIVSDLIKKLDKIEVRSKDQPGFIANRILMPMIREAIRALEDGVANRNDIDQCMVSCCNFPIGPLALADLIGLDTCTSILNVMADGLGNDHHRPPKLLEKMVAQGKLGRKTKKGFYDY